MRTSINTMTNHLTANLPLSAHNVSCSRGLTVMGSGLWLPSFTAFSAVIENKIVS